MSTYLYGGHVQANGIRQHYLRYGGKKEGIDPVIIVPGITSPAVTWGYVGEHFGQYFDTYILDVRGRGLSEASDNLDYSVDAQAADLLAFAEELGLKSYSVVGHSMGARIGLRAARSQPAALTKLVMLDPPVSGPGRREYPSKLPWYVDSIRMANKGISLEEMREFCPTWTEEQVRLRAQWLHTCNESAIRTSFEDFHRDDCHADMPHINIPTMLMVAGRGGVILEEDINEIKALLENVEVTHVPDAGHMIPWDDEQGFYRAFGSFLGTSLVD
ncbi:alpha/beta hydrolase [Oceanisphaera sediminis]|uniref:Alpha/beta hydrolase n=1 Tax=Oceanisphaera sediminis TaxID=981381 RepID=A0ABP7DQF2_9GAMM